MEEVVIACYKPKQGKENELRQLVKFHIPLLREQKLITNREPVIIESVDGTIIEIFGWKSAAAIDEAHKNASVIQLWEKFGEVCEYIPIAEVEEARNIFSGFKAFKQ